LNAPPNHPAIKKSTSDRTDLAGVGGSVGNIRAARLASLGLARFRTVSGSRGLLMWWRSRFALVVVAWLVFVPPAVGFEQVAGSPFATSDGPVGIAFSAGGRLLATANYSDVSVFSVNRRSGALSGVPGSPFFGVEDRGDAVAFNPDGRLLAETGSYTDPAMGVFSVNASTGALSPVTGLPFPSRSGGVAFSPDGRLLATPITGVGVFSVDPSTGALSAVPGSPFGTEAGAVAFSPSGDLLATITAADSVSVFSVDHTTGALRPVAGSPFSTGPRSEAESVAFSPDGRLLAAGNTTEVYGSRVVHSVSVFSVHPSTGALSPIAGSPFSTPSGVWGVAFSPVGGLLATANISASSVSVFSTAPVISSAHESAQTWREGDTLPSINAKRDQQPPVGTTFSFTLNEPATVTLGFTKNTPGRNIPHGCRASAQHNRHHPRCTRTVAAGTLTFTGRRGRNKVRFDGRISTSKKLSPGPYRLVITATDASDKERSASGSLRFTILRDRA
jgi:6-phosphogluconolactonase (cycloisomerase 2 family)